ncbi:sporulation inhibitor of replication protein SirA [Peribacillus tepidiphilus]|uniref:sporulation inhibitor of replication protein SirA n=1 Tax=Peribacillus tepidiphilus TaxID=2652445 RepID=UPI0035B5253E
MRNYQIYLIHDEFARHYMGREKMFFGLFMDYKHSSGELTEIIERQIDYVTKPIPVLSLRHRLEQEFMKNKHFHLDNGVYYVQKIKGNGRARIDIQPKSISLTIEGQYDAEAIFFECFRKCESFLLAIDLEHGRYGWLKPIKERKFV